MKKKNSKFKSIFVIILVVVIGCMIGFNFFKNITLKVYASATTYTKSFFSGYSSGMNDEQLHYLTRLQNNVEDLPSITILVHGQGGSANNFSNDGNSNFVYDKDSLLDVLDLRSSYMLTYFGQNLKQKGKL